MPTHNETTKPTGTELKYVRPTLGRFEMDDKTFQVLEGKFTRLWTQEDPGDKTRKIAAGTKLIVDLEDDDFLYRVQVRIETTFGWSLVSYLSHITAGDYLKLEAKPGDDPKITLLNFYRQVDGEWVWGVREEFPKGPENATARLAKALEIVAAHPALYVKPEKE